MKNKILAVIRDTIPYVKELRPYAKSIAGCIVMQQLDYWFFRYPDGFYKFLAPCNHKAYRSGDSWLEELGVSKEEFRTAFDNIGVRYASKKEFDDAPDKFQGKFYCSYHNKREGETWYFRNDEAVDAMLDTLSIAPSSGSWQSQSPEVGNPNLQKLAIPISISKPPQSVRVGKANPESNREQAEITQREQQQENPVVVASDSVPDPGHSETVVALNALGLTLSTAQSLVRKYGSVACRKQMDALPHRKHDPTKGTREGMLRKSVEEDWPVPPRANSDSIRVQNLHPKKIDSKQTNLKKQKEEKDFCVCEEEKETDPLADMRRGLAPAKQKFHKIPR